MHPFASARILFGSFAVWLANAACAGAPPAALALGITPESLTVAGLSTSQAADLLTRIAAETELCSALQTHGASVNEATQLVTQLADALKGETDDPATLQADYEAALAQLASAKALVDQVRQNLLESVTEPLNSGQIERLDAWRDSIGMNVPAAFRVTVRTAEQWAEIQTALRAETRAERLGQTLATEYSQTLGSVRGESAVVQAQANLATTLTAMKSTFESQ